MKTIFWKGPHIWNLINDIKSTLSLERKQSNGKVGGNVTPWCSGYHYCTTSFNKAWTQILHRLKPCLRCVSYLRWWKSLTMVPAENRAWKPFIGQPFRKNNSSWSSSLACPCRIKKTDMQNVGFTSGQNIQSITKDQPIVTFI